MEIAGENAFQFNAEHLFAHSRPPFLTASKENARINEAIIALTEADVDSADDSLVKTSEEVV